ncbi:hypothetical protein D3C87_1264530 [compost metagenome]
MGTQDVILQLLQRIGSRTLILGLQRLDTVLPDSVELLALGRRLLLLDKGDILLQALFGIFCRAGSKGEGNIFILLVRYLGADPLGHLFEQQPLAFRINYIRLRHIGIQITFLQQKLTLVIEAVEAVDKITIERRFVKGGEGGRRYLSVNQLVDIELE